MGNRRESDPPFRQIRFVHFAADHPTALRGGVGLRRRLRTPPPKTLRLGAPYADGIPLSTFAVDDIHKEYERMTKLGVAFRIKPTRTGPVTVAIFDDTCGNLI